MINQKWKDRFYVLSGPLLWLNLHRHKMLASRFRQDIKTNIGCGKSQFEGWLNIDGNIMHRPDIWLDVRYGLPFSSGSVRVINSCHFFEHFYLEELRTLLIECRRILRPDGGMRIATPNLHSAIQVYCRKDKEWFSGFPSEFRTLGGRFFNEMLCDGQHRITFDFDFMVEVLTEAGFRTVYEMRRGESKLLKSDDEVLKHELASSSHKVPDPWLIVEALP